MNPVLQAHADAGGDLCNDEDGDGCCDLCGVTLGQDCLDCDGNGYHRAGCPSAEDTVHLEPSDAIMFRVGLGSCGRMGDRHVDLNLVTCPKCLEAKS